LRRLLVSALFVAGLSLVPGPLDPSADAVAASVPVTLAGFSDITVDEAHGHVFVSQGAKGGVVVADLHGDACTA